MHFSAAPIISYHPQEENIVFSSQSSPEYQKTHQGYLKLLKGDCMLIQLRHCRQFSSILQEVSVQYKHLRPGMTPKAVWAFFAVPRLFLLQPFGIDCHRSFLILK